LPAITKLIDHSVSTYTNVAWACLLTQTGQPDLYGLQPELYGLKPELYGLQPELYSLKPELYGLQPELHDLQPALYGLQPEYATISSCFGKAT
jgi:hypothetical protein